MLGPMAGKAEGQPLPSNRAGQLADDVPSRPQPGSRPLGERRIVHGEPDVVLRHRHHEPGARVAEQLGPLIGIELRRVEEGDEVLVPELTVTTVGRQVMRVLGRTGLVHGARVPLVAEAGHAVRPPVDEDAELAIHVPSRRLVPAQRFPRRLERPRRQPPGWDLSISRHILPLLLCGPAALRWPPRLVGRAALLYNSSGRRL
jgi:hypothetical protein